MAAGLTPEQVDATLDQTAANKEDNPGDFLMQLFGGTPSDSSIETPTTPSRPSLEHIDEPASLFNSDFHYARTTLAQLNQGLMFQAVHCRRPRNRRGAVAEPRRARLADRAAALVQPRRHRRLDPRHLW